MVNPFIQKALYKLALSVTYSVIYCEVNKVIFFFHIMDDHTETSASTCLVRLDIGVNIMGKIQLKKKKRT